MILKYGHWHTLNTETEPVRVSLTYNLHIFGVSAYLIWFGRERFGLYGIQIWTVNFFCFVSGVFSKERETGFFTSLAHLPWSCCSIVSVCFKRIISRHKICKICYSCLGNFTFNLFLQYCIIVKMPLFADRNVVLHVSSRQLAVVSLRTALCRVCC